MANLYFHNPQSIERSSKRMHVEIAIGASGAPTIQRGLQVSSVVRNSAGSYTVTFPKFNRFLGAHFTRVLATLEFASIQVTAFNAAAGTVTFVTSLAGAAADLTSGTVIYMDVDFKNTAVAN